MTVTKADLVQLVVDRAHIKRDEADTAVRVILEGIVEALNRDEKVELRGFGSFRVRRRAARVGRNPKTGAKVDVPEKRIPYFKPGKLLRERLLDD